MTEEKSPHQFVGKSRGVVAHTHMHTRPSQNSPPRPPYTLLHFGTCIYVLIHELLFELPYIMSSHFGFSLFLAEMVDCTFYAFMDARGKALWE